MTKKIQISQWKNIKKYFLLKPVPNPIKSNKKKSLWDKHIDGLNLETTGPKNGHQTRKFFKIY